MFNLIVAAIIPKWCHSGPPQEQIEQENCAGYGVGGSQCDVGEAVFGHGSVVEGGYKVSSSGYTNHFKLACHVRQTLGYEFNGLLQAIRINNQSWAVAYSVVWQEPDLESLGCAKVHVVGRGEWESSFCASSLSSYEHRCPKLQKNLFRQASSLPLSEL